MTSVTDCGAQAHAAAAAPESPEVTWWVDASPWYGLQGLRGIATNGSFVYCVGDQGYETKLNADSGGLIWSLDEAAWSGAPELDATTGPTTSYGQFSVGVEGLLARVGQNGESYTPWDVSPWEGNQALSVLVQQGSGYYLTSGPQGIVLDFAWNGSTRWMKDVGSYTGQGVTAIATTPRESVVGVCDGGIMFFLTPQGDSLWAADVTPWGGIQGLLAVAADAEFAYAVGGRGWLTKVRLSDGAVMQTADVTPWSGNQALQALVRVGVFGYAVGGEGNLVQIDLRDCSVVSYIDASPWSSSQGLSAAAVSPAGTTLFVTGPEGNVAKITLHQQPMDVLIPDAFSTIQAGLYSAASVDRVLVRPGTYHEGTLSVGGKGLPCHLASMGGSSATIIDAGGLTNSLIFDGERSYVVEGFTLRNAVAALHLYSREHVTLKDVQVEACTGGAAVSAGYETSLFLQDCRIHDNSGGQSGGVLSCSSCDTLDLADTMIDHNAQPLGGWALSATSAGRPSAITLSRVVVRDNACYGANLAVPFLQVDSLLVENNVGYGLRSTCPTPSWNRVHVLNNQGPGVNSVSLMNAEVRGNHGGFGGVLTNEIRDCQVVANIGDSYAGGVYLYSEAGRPALVANCLIEGNSSNVVGGGVYATCDFRMENTILVGNVAGGSLAKVDQQAEALSGGGGIAFASGSGDSAVILESVIVGNSASRGGGLLVSGNRSVVLDGSLVWGNCASVSPCAQLDSTESQIAVTCSVFDTAGCSGLGSVSLATGAMAQDPLLCAAVGCPASSTQSVLYVEPGSVCLAGNNPCGAAIGMAIEGCVSTGVSGGEEEELRPGFAIGPNPGRGRVLLVARSSVDGPCALSIFDVSGRLVRRLESAVVSGEARFVWNGDNDSGSPVVSGIYLVRLDGALDVKPARLAYFR